MLKIAHSHLKNLLPVTAYLIMTVVSLFTALLCVYFKMENISLLYLMTFITSLNVISFIILFSKVLFPLSVSRLKLKNELQKKVEQTKLIENIASIGNWELDVKTGATIWSDEVYRIHKIPLGTPTNKVKGLEFFAPHDRERITRCVEECIQKQKTYDEIFEFFDAEGNPKWVRAIGSPLLDDNGEVCKLVGVFQDITVSRELEEERRFILSTARVGVWKWNVVNNVLTWDESMFKLFGVNKEDFKGAYEAWESTLHPDYKEKAVTDLQEALYKNVPFDTSFAIVTKENEVKYIGARGSIERDSNGNPVYMYGVNWDKTNEQKYQNQLEDQKKIAFHNAKLASIGQLAAGVGHEINNPLAIIRGYISIMQKKNSVGVKVTPEDLTAKLEKIDLAVDRVANIVRGLRTFSRSDFDKSDVFDIGEAINEYLNLIKEIYQKEGITIIKLGDGFKSEIYISGNRGKIQQVIMNFLSNAKDATEGLKERKIEIHLKTLENRVELRVCDNGHGIPEHLEEKVFDPFFTTKDIGKGTGIGLSISKNIIEECGGSLSYVRGEMTTFQVLLPTLNIVKDPDNNKKSTVAFKGEGKKLLLVEDEGEIREHLDNLLTSMGFDVTACAHGGIAYEEYCELEGRFDIILSDMKMPVMDGKALIKRVRNNTRFPQPRFVAMTGGIDIDFEDSSNEISGMIDAYLLKPFSEAQIRKVLQFVCEPVKKVA